LALYNSSRARAAIQGRPYVIPDDIKALAEPTLAHRIIVTPSARIKNVDSRTVIFEILRALPVPGARPTAAGGRGWAAD
jgi:MoxR-like ATPase